MCVLCVSREMDVNKGQKDTEGSKTELHMDNEELCEALAVLSGSDPDHCSYQEVRFII